MVLELWVCMLGALQLCPFINQAAHSGGWQLLLPHDIWPHSNPMITTPLSCVPQTLITIFTEKKYMRGLSQDTPAILGSGLEELVR
jgi:hypothetical protein